MQEAINRENILINTLIVKTNKQINLSLPFKFLLREFTGFSFKPQILKNKLVKESNLQGSTALLFLKLKGFFNFS